MLPMRLPVFLRLQNPLVDKPAHHVSFGLADQIVKVRLARMLSGRAIHLTTDESWAATKNRFRVVNRSIPQLLPPLAFYPSFMTSYPPTPRNERERQHQKEMWLRVKEPFGSGKQTRVRVFL